MKQKIILLIVFAIPLFCMAQTPLTREYDYDEAGNRISCKVLRLSEPMLAPPDSTEREELAVTSNELLELATEYFVEKIAQTEIKIYPNPATEKITLAISEWENLQMGVFKLYSLTGQLLQEQPVHSSTTVISLSGYSKGVYILKVQINGITEDWKIIKH